MQQQSDDTVTCPRPIVDRHGQPKVHRDGSPWWCGRHLGTKQPDGTYVADDHNLGRRVYQSRLEVLTTCTYPRHA